MPTDKAKRETIFVGSFETEGFMMPNGSYRMSQTPAAECIGLGAQNASRFFSQKRSKPCEETRARLMVLTQAMEAIADV